MTVSVLVDGRVVAPSPEESPTLFALAESVGVRVPTSCFGQGKCRECLVEVEEGSELLSPRAEARVVERASPGDRQQRPADCRPAERLPRPRGVAAEGWAGAESAPSASAKSASSG